MGGVAVICTFLFPVVAVLRRPTVDAWLNCVYGALLTAAVGTLLLFCAKIPQYRAGVFWRIGCSHFPPRSRQLYRLACLLIVPSCLVLIGLLLVAHRIS